MWIKKGLLLDINDFLSKTISSHASIPYCMHIKDDNFRIYFSSRDMNGKSYPYSIDAIITDGKIELKGNIVGPLLDLGELGTFDDSGIMPSSIVKVGNEIYMYYIGWNPQVSVSYRLSIGLAISTDGGIKFKKAFDGPICDRTKEEPYFNTAPFVIKEKASWKMWYVSCTEWNIINQYPEPVYHVKYAESQDGINWEKKGIICIDYDCKAKAIGRPSVIKCNNQYIMYFSYRNTLNYRTVKGEGYQIARASSRDGINWSKKYNVEGLNLSCIGWDSMMMEYSHVFYHHGIQYMLYNGNSFGKDGFGYAVAPQLSSFD